MYRKKVIVGYRRPKNIRDVLIHANIPRQTGDEAVYPMTPIRALEAARIAKTQAPVIPAREKVQKEMTDFFHTRSETDLTSIRENSTIRPIPGLIGASRRMGTAPKQWGFSFCKNTAICRYCPKINKTEYCQSRNREGVQLHEKSLMQELEPDLLHKLQLEWHAIRWSNTTKAHG